MGYGKNLEKALKDRGWSVAELSRQTKINDNTLRSIIRRDSAVRYDYALRISNVLGIDINLICKENPYQDGPTEPGMLKEFGGLMTNINKSSYLKYRLGNVLNLYEYSEFPIIDQLLTEFYRADDEGRKKILDYIRFVLISNTCSERDQDIKNITRPNNK
jgi:lambda repressor-like predicted transcriptional regulator